MTNNKQQTAVEWFSVRRDVLEIEVRLGKLSPIEYAEELTKAEQQAKEMERQRMINFTEDWYFNGFPLEGGGGDVEETIEQHYNETYGGGER
jgi:hypothetical protein